MKAATIRSLVGSLLLGLTTLASLGVSPVRAADATPASARATATFAGGCFWCMQPPFEHLDGVLKTTVGYTGGHTPNPSYQEVSAGETGHTESIQIEYDPAKISYNKLLDVFWHNVDPLTPNAQFCDHGDEYRTAIFYHDETQRRLAQESKQHLEQTQHFDRPIVTQIVPATDFYPAEDYHQMYRAKNPVRYKYYRWNCGRDQRLKEVWGDAAGHMEEER